MRFMLDRLGQDCSPLQFLRELTQNALESILRLRPPKGEIIWDVDWNRHTLTGVYKLAIIDTGLGMTGEEMVEYINALSSSMSEQSESGNFGVGAKIAAAPRNHAGLVYLSWKDGVGYMIHLWRDPDSGIYGLRQFARPDGSYGHWAHIQDDIKPVTIKDHGTMVVLLGHETDQDTMQAPETAASPSRWIARYLNTRYFRFPDGITVKAREGWEYPRSNKDTNLLRTVSGQDLLKSWPTCAVWWWSRLWRLLRFGVGCAKTGGQRFSDANAGQTRDASLCWSQSRSEELDRQCDCSSLSEGIPRFRTKRSEALQFDAPVVLCSDIKDSREGG